MDVGGQEQPEQEEEIMMFGAVDLTDNEKELLMLGPDFMVVADLDQEEMDMESRVTMTKVCWGKMAKGRENLTGRQEDKEEEEEPTTELGCVIIWFASQKFFFGVLFSGGDYYKIL